MRHGNRAVPLALFAAAVSAQTIVNDPSDTAVTTVFYSVCPTTTETTITLASTLTYCPGPGCNGGTPAITPAPGAGVPDFSGGDGPLGTEIMDYTTVGPDGKTTHYQEFETIYGQPCSTCPGGTTPTTFTVTEPCPCEASRNPSSMPEGFTTTVFTCDTCAHNGGPVTTTLTVPCSTGPFANQATATGGAAADTGSGSGNGASAGAPGAGTPGATAANVSAAGAGAGSNTGTPGSGSNAPASAGSANVAGLGGQAGQTEADVAPTATPMAGAGTHGGSNSTVSLPISPVAPGAAGISAYKPGSGAGKAGVTMIGLVGLFVGVLAFML